MRPTPERATVAQYEAVLRTFIERGIAPSIIEMLRAQYAMPGRVTTMRRLAQAAGFGNSWSAANRVFGGFAGRVRREMDLQYHGLALWTIGYWPVPEDEQLEEFSFRMRPNFAKALERVGLVVNARPGPAPRKQPPRSLEGERSRSMRTHLRREAGLREAKIAESSRRSPDGRLRCEVPGCAFDFEDRYGVQGKGYIQVHHLEPLSARAEASETSLDELVLICANCHAMVHRDGANRSLQTLLHRG
ncbi:MAG: HNH endonuclease [Gemmatimonadaceae bacterium]|nr:HNH endonuclease [Gemmatimonadaceae bacterium]